MRIAVTGATGFIGQHVVAEAQRRGHEVRVLAGPNHSGIDLRTGEGLAEQLRGSDVVIHCAAAMGGDLATQKSITVDGTPQPNAFTCGDTWREKFLTDIRKGQQVVIHAEGDEGTQFAMELVIRQDTDES